MPAVAGFAAGEFLRLSLASIVIGLHAGNYSGYWPVSACIGL
jgi:hypothetical protein